MTSRGPNSYNNNSSQLPNQRQPRIVTSASSRASERINRLFGEKMVMELSCRFCATALCDRGMKALLLADTSTELYSTDLSPHAATTLVGGDYQTPCCDCRISDVACLTW